MSDLGWRTGVLVSANIAIGFGLVLRKPLIPLLESVVLHSEEDLVLGCLCVVVEVVEAACVGCLCPHQMYERITLVGCC
jgi:hypothetical protein